MEERLLEENRKEINQKITIKNWRFYIFLVIYIGMDIFSTILYKKTLNYLIDYPFIVQMVIVLFSFCFFLLGVKI